MLTDLLDVRTKVLEQDLIVEQVEIHAGSVCDRPQRPTKDEAVKAGQHTRDLVLVLRDKLQHGVSTPVGRGFGYHILTRAETPSFLVAAPPRCGEKQTRDDGAL